MPDSTLTKRPFGTTGLQVTPMAFGTGGRSKAGMASGEEYVATMVGAALDLGINTIDTAEYYRTESAVGQAVQGRDRAGLVICTKIAYRIEGRFRTAAEVKTAVELAVQRLGDAPIDVLHLHGVLPDHYEQVRDRHLPTLESLRSAGLIRCLAVSEAFERDHRHLMLDKAVTDGCWQVMMVGFNLLNQSARQRILAAAQAQGIGVLAMFAVRGALRDGASLRSYLARRRAEGRTSLDPESTAAACEDAVTAAGATDLTDLAYRFVRDEPGIHTVLAGTGNPDHLRANVASLARPALATDLRHRLIALVTNEDGLTGQDW